MYEPLKRKLVKDALFFLNKKGSNNVKHKQQSYMTISPRARAGDDGALGSHEDGFRMFLLQSGAAWYLGREVIAWALDILLEAE